jgi:hypothetical protein
MSWAKQTADNIRSEEVSKSIEGQRFIEEQRLRRALGPSLCSDLKNKLKEKCDELNNEISRPILNFDVLPSSQASIRRMDKPAVLNVQFDLDAYRVRYSCGAGKGEYLFRVEPDTTLVLETPYHVPHTTEEVAEHLLDQLLKSPL